MPLMMQTFNQLPSDASLIPRKSFANHLLAVVVRMLVQKITSHVELESWMQRPKMTSIYSRVSLPGQSKSESRGAVKRVAAPARA